MIHINPAIWIALATVASLMIILGGAYVITLFNGGTVPIPTTPRSVMSYGDQDSQLLKYAVMGDSTAVGQGGAYETGIAVQSARYIASAGYAVEMKNVAVSGARTRDIVTNQIGQMQNFRPDIVLLSVTANDVTHGTSLDSISSDTVKIINELRRLNPAVLIIHTGAPQMGAVPRLVWPLRYIAGLRVASINARLRDELARQNVRLVPLAAETGPRFAAEPSLFAIDKFHPTTKGYDVWAPVINRSIGQELERL